MVTALAVPESPETLPAIIDAAQRALADARTSAEVLEARDLAAAAYDAARRFTRRRAAFDHMTALAMRMQAQALRIEARAKERLANEYDAAQDRGEVARIGDNLPSVAASKFKATAADLGLRGDEIHEARRFRDAERADPGAIDRAIDRAVAEGRAPTRVELKRALGIAKPVAQPAPEPDWLAGLRQHMPRWDLPFFTWAETNPEGFAEMAEAARRLSEEERAAIHRAARCLMRLSEEIGQ